MLIQGSVLSERTDILIRKYIELLENEVEADEILVLVQNSYKKDKFINEVKNSFKKNYFINPQIYTFYGLCHNTILDCWPIIEDSIKNGKSLILPNLNGLEISHFFWRQAVKEIGFNDYNSKINLIHQLFRRYSLIANNNLSQNEIQTRSNILKESFSDDAKEAIDLFKKKTIEYRSFDYIRQIDLFKYVFEKTNHFSKIKYLILDDADEITQAEFDFVKALYPQLVEIFVGYDKYGSTRLGYLNTDIKTVENLENSFKNEKIINLDNIEKAFVSVQKNSFSKRNEMIDQVVCEIQSLLKSGVKAEQICIVTPTIDSLLKSRVFETLISQNINAQYLSGNEKLSDNPIIENILTILRLSLNDEIDIYKIRSIFNKILDIPLKYCLPLIETFKSEHEIKYVDLKNEKYNTKLNLFLLTINEIQKMELLSEKVYHLYQSLIVEKKYSNEIHSKIKFLIKQITDFESVFVEHKCSEIFQKNVISQLENSIISENPSSAPEFKENSIIISTAQKIIDYSIKKDYMFLLDTTSLEWIRDDFGTLYNAWVFQKSWDKNSFAYEDNIELSEIKAKKMLRKLFLLAKTKIYSYSSLYDTKGFENNIGVDKFIETQDFQPKLTKSEFVFVPREDQKPIVAYKKGRLAISAVPGAGKTTVLLALIINLLKNGVKSENIFVMTYMESAARNFRERIQKAYPELDRLPNISTIHGLALRILKENSNFTKAGLDENFEICDDAQRQKIIWELIALYGLNQDDFEKYERAISILKLSNHKQKQYIKDADIKKFLSFYNNYNKYLNSKNLVDYDDMLCLSVKILEENQDIAEYYANICEYVIEDEAQDSSAIQQRLLNLLSSKHKNLIRCGDINQAITTTFTNSDIDGFKNFIQKSQNIEMNQSQRCAKDIFELANKLVDFSKTNPYYQNAFYDIKMKMVEGKNPVSENAFQSFIFEDYKLEKEFMLEQIRKAFLQNPNATIGVLVRNNYQVDEYVNYFKTFGYKIQTQNDMLKNQPVFSLLLGILDFILHPWRNDIVEQCARIFQEQKLIDLSHNDFEYINNLKTPFILENQDDLSEKLANLLWDLQYWLENSYLNIEEFAIKVGHYYYSSETEKSNTYITALLLKTVESQYKTKDHFLERLRELANKPIGSKYKFFEDDVSKQDVTKNGIIQIMTYHKSKGDEFDYVFIPELSEETLPLEIDNIKIKSKERFIEAIKRLNLEYKNKDELEQKVFQIEENLRLLYVAITRAKKKLFISSAKKYKKYSRIKEVKSSILFTTVLGQNQ